MVLQETIKAEAAAEKEEIIRQSAEAAKQSIITQRSHFETEMGIMKNRLDHEKVQQLFENICPVPIWPIYLCKCTDAYRIPQWPVGTYRQKPCSDCEHGCMPIRVAASASLCVGAGHV